MKLVIMTTGRSPSTVAQTLASVLASDWTGPVVVSTDPTGKEQLRHLLHHRRVDLDVQSPTEWNRVKDGRVHRKAGAHYCRCLRMLRDDPEGGIILEDDVVVRDDLLSKTRQLATRARDRGSRSDFVLLLYSSRNPRNLGLREPLNDLPSELFFGTQAVYWTAESAHLVEPWLRERAVERDESVYDLLIRRFAIDRSQPIFALPHESLVQHVGASTTGMGEFHRSPTFANGVASKTKTCMLTVGMGRGWAALATRLADRWKILNPTHHVQAITTLPSWLPCGLPSASWLKIWGWELVPRWCETLVWVDADVIPMCTVSPLPDGVFCAVPDALSSASHAWRAMSALDKHKPYYNAGIWIARRPARPLFEALKQLLIAGSWRGQPFYEQSFVNLLLQNMPIKVTALSREYNWMGAFGNPPDDARLVHRAGSHSGLDEWWKKADEALRSGRALKPSPTAQPAERTPIVEPTITRKSTPAKRRPQHPPKPLSKPRSKRG